MPILGRRTLWCALVLLGCGDAGHDAAEADELDTAWSTWSDEATPATAAPIWYAQSLKLSGAKLDKMARRAGSSSREPIALFAGAAGASASTGGFLLRAGEYGALIQFHEMAGSFGAPLADVSLLDHQTEAVTRTLGQLSAKDEGVVSGDPGGWRRAYLRFTVSKADEGRAMRIQLKQSASTQSWRLGAVVLHREGRPFWAVAHNPNGMNQLRAAIAQGANAIEPDLSYGSDEGTRPLEERVSVAEEGSTLMMGCPINSFGRSKLDDYLKVLRDEAPGRLMIWDSKPGGCRGEHVDYTLFAQLFVDGAKRAGFDLSRSVYNITSENMSPAYNALPEGMGRAWDGIFVQVNQRSDAEWMAPVLAHQLTFQGLGVTPLLQINAKWTKPIATYVRAREQGAMPQKIYFWTANEDFAIRRVLDTSIDALISDDIPLLRQILNTFPYSRMYRYANEQDDVHARYEPGWIKPAP